MSDEIDIDHPRLLAEIAAEARRRRESGELPADFERELDLAFARLTPVHAAGDDFAQVLERAEQSTFIDVLAPLESTVPLVPQVKRVVRKAISWEVRHVAQQVSAFASAATRAVRLLGERVDALERSAPAAAARLVPDLAAADPLAVDDWAPVVLDALQGTAGRVLHAECGEGELVARLVGAGLDAYGVDPVERATPPGFEVRVDDVLAHLGALPEECLGGIVLSGLVERLPAGSLVELATAASSRVVPGGVVVVVSADPRAWARSRPAPAADLAPGRPLQPETWCRLLAGRGLEAAVVAERPADEGLEPVPGADPALAANLRRVGEILFPPTGYAVVARRRS